MSEKKVVSRKVTLGITILCVIVLIGFSGAVINYNLLLNAKDAIISEKNLAIGNQTSQLSDLQESLNEKQSEIDDLTSQIVQENSTISNLDARISKKDSQISSLNSQISQKESTIANLNSQISNLESQKDSLNSQILNLNSQISDIQSQKDSLTLEILNLNSQIANLQMLYDDYVEAYQDLRYAVNQRSTHIGISDFITPQDFDVISTVYSITGGWSDTSDFNEFWTDIKSLYSWTRANIEYRYDGLSPVLPFIPSNNLLYYTQDMWQFPNETLDLKMGDCDDQAILLCSMIRCYMNRAYSAACVWITGSNAAHVGVQIPVAGDKLVIFDPAGNYYSKDLLGNIVFNDISVEIDNWLNYWKPTIGSDIRVYRVFSDDFDLTFASTNEYLSWMY